MSFKPLHAITNVSENSNETDPMKYLIDNVYGVGAIKNTVKKNIVKYIGNSIRNNHVVVLQFSSPEDIGMVTQILKKLDKNFAKHTFNTDTRPIINSQFIINCGHRTYILVDGNYQINRERAIYSIKFYIIGAHREALAKVINKQLKKLGTLNLHCYSIEADPSGNDQGYWTCTCSDMITRDFNTLYFDTDINESIKTHLDKWLKSEPIYKERGLLFKTGILIHGNAGTGKSSLATAIATYLNCDLVNINTASFSRLNISEVVDSINSDNKRYVILLDEIDTIFKSRDDENLSEEDKNKATKLLTFLDSPQSPNNVVFVATTNYIDRLDPAMMRKGRFNLIEEVPNMHIGTAQRMCHGFGLKETDITKVLKKYQNETTINPATLQADILDIIEVNSDGNIGDSEI